MKIAMLLMVLTVSFLSVGVHRVTGSERHYPEPDCMINAGPCVKTVDGLTVVFDIAPKPLKTMRSLLFRTTILNKDKPVVDAIVSTDLSMPGMFMGQNIVGLSHLRDGIYEGKGVIIRCPSGKKVWRASVEIRRPGKPSVVDYIFEVQ
jgi:hypothetical protein